jgi:hypothetical protein
MLASAGNNRNRGIEDEGDYDQRTIEGNEKRAEEDYQHPIFREMSKLQLALRFTGTRRNPNKLTCLAVPFRVLRFLRVLRAMLFSCFPKASTLKMQVDLSLQEAGRFAQIVNPIHAVFDRDPGGKAYRV